MNQLTRPQLRTWDSWWCQRCVYLQRLTKNELRLTHRCQFCNQPMRKLTN